MLTDEVGNRHAGTEGRACTRVTRTEDASRDVAARVQARYRLLVGAEHLAVTVNDAVDFVEPAVLD